MDFNTDVRSMKWEFGFWGENITQWYAEGLPKKVGTNLPTNLTTVSASLYTTAWTHQWRQQRTYLEKFYGEREAGDPFAARHCHSGVARSYWPSQGFPLALDVMDYFGFDKSTALVCVEQLFSPFFEPKILSEDDRISALRRYRRRRAGIPEAGGRDPQRASLADQGLGDVAGDQGAAPAAGHHPGSLSG